MVYLNVSCALSFTPPEGKKIKHQTPTIKPKKNSKMMTRGGIVLGHLRFTQEDENAGCCEQKKKQKTYKMERVSGS